jgi:hypothetical protein
MATRASLCRQGRPLTPGTLDGHAGRVDVPDARGAGAAGLPVYVDPVTGELAAQAAPIAHDLRDLVMPVGR